MPQSLCLPGEQLEISVPANGRVQLCGRCHGQCRRSDSHTCPVVLTTGWCPMLSCCRCGNLLWPGLALGDRAASALGALMVQSQRTCLMRIDLRANEISDAGAAQLAEGIELNRSVTHLLISDNNITDHGALALARALYRNRTLTVLWLDGAAFTTLKSLNTEHLVFHTCCGAVTGNDISIRGTTAISQAVANNEHLTTVVLHRKGHTRLRHRALSTVEKRDLAVIRQSCARNQMKRKSRKALCHRLQMLAWAIAVRKGCVSSCKSAATS